MGGGTTHNKHVYDVHCAVITDLTFLTRKHLLELDKDYPAFKLQVRKLAAKRAQRFGINLSSTSLQSASLYLDVSPATACCVEITFGFTFGRF